VNYGIEAFKVAIVTISLDKSWTRLLAYISERRYLLFTILRWVVQKAPEAKIYPMHILGIEGEVILEWVQKVLRHTRVVKGKVSKNGALRVLKTDAQMAWRTLPFAIEQSKALSLFWG